jgi:hypothetical protein
MSKKFKVVTKVPTFTYYYFVVEADSRREAEDLAMSGAEDYYIEVPNSEIDEDGEELVSCEEI